MKISESKEAPLNFPGALLLTKYYVWTNFSSCFENRFIVCTSYKLLTIVVAEKKPVIIDAGSKHIFWLNFLSFSLTSMRDSKMQICLKEICR